MSERRLLFSAKDIARRLQKLARQISQDFKGQPVVFLGVLKGAFIFLADLVREVHLNDITIDFIRLASYGANDISSGQVRLTKAPEIPLEGQNVIVVEDIVDTGLTLHYLRRYLEENYHPRCVKICCLIDKAERREIPINIDYCGFRVPQGFLVGYGLDYAEKYRNLPGVYELIM